MGWTFVQADYFKNGNVDRKAECDSYISLGDDMEVVKSRMVGSTYYAAVRLLKGLDTSGNIKLYSRESAPVVGMVMLTQVRARDAFNFGYKVMDETMGPVETNCPITILDELSPTDDRAAYEWRQKCKESHAKRKLRQTLSELKVGSQIQIEWNGEPIVLTKATNANFKKPVWLDLQHHRRMPKQYIEDFTVIHST